jgi:dolichol-phosphate mannosyltransferase
MDPLIVIPTYNERENLEAIAAGALAALPPAHLLIVDDNSPDGTGSLADALAARDRRIHVLHRPGKQGLGTAYIQGFHYALDHGYEAIFEMDADFSHDPRMLPALLAAAQDADLVIGSRYIPGGSTPNWSALRRFISGGGNTFARMALRMPVRDCTSGYRCYRRRVLEAIDLDAIRSQGYAFQVELVYQALRHGMRVTEVPIAFIDRRVGQSKMSRTIFIEAFRFVMRTRRQSGAVPRLAPGQVRRLPPIASGRERAAIPR